MNNTGTLTFAPTLALWFKSNNSDFSMNVFSGFSFNMISSGLQEDGGLQNQIKVFKVFNNSDKIEADYNDDKYIPFNLKGIQNKALNGKKWTAGSPNPLDEPIYRHKKLWKYLFDRISFYYSSDPDEMKKVQNVNCEDLQICLTNGNPKYDKIVTLAANSLQNNDTLLETIQKQLPANYFKDNFMLPETTELSTLQNIMEKQKMNFRCTVKIYINETYVTFQIFCETPKNIALQNILRHIETTNPSKTIREYDSRFANLNNEDPLYMLDGLDKDDKLYFTVT